MVSEARRASSSACASAARQIQELLDLLLGLVDLRAHLALLLGVEFAQPLEQHGQRAILAQEAGLFVFERGGVMAAAKRSCAWETRSSID